MRGPRRTAGRTSPLDRVWRDHWGIHVMTPIETADVDQWRARFAEFMAGHPSDALSCNLSEDATRWIPVATEVRRAHVEDVIVAGTALDDADDPYAAMLADRPPSGYRAPFRMVVGRNSLVIYVNHVIGDVLVITWFTSLLAQGQIVGLSEGCAKAGVPELIRMALGQSVTHWPEWFRRRRSTVAVRAAEPPVVPVASAAPATAAVGFVLDAQRYREFVEWRAAQRPDVSVTALMASAVHRALRHENLPVADDGLHVLVDLRRYLPPSAGMRQGNLAVSVLLPTDLTDPAAVGRDLRKLLEGADAIPILLKAVAMQFLSRRRVGRCEQPVAPARPHVRLTFNSMRRNPGIATIPWLDRTRARYMGMSYPIEANGISVFACIVDDRMEFSASFRSDVLDRAAVQRALNRLQDMPSLLD